MLSFFLISISALWLIWCLFLHCYSIYNFLCVLWYEVCHSKLILSLWSSKLHPCILIGRHHCFRGICWRHIVAPTYQNTWCHSSEYHSINVGFEVITLVMTMKNTVYWVIAEQFSRSVSIFLQNVSRLLPGYTAPWTISVFMTGNLRPYIIKIIILSHL
jgi:hypothetical protein